MHVDKTTPNQTKKTLYIPITEERLSSSTRVSSRMACRMGMGALQISLCRVRGLSQILSAGKLSALWAPYSKTCPSWNNQVITKVLAKT